MALDKELLKGCTKTLVLEFLSKAPMHGYELSSQIKAASGGEIEVTEGTIYPLLHSLEKDGAIVAKWDSSAGKRKRKIYRITAEGRKQVKARKQDWQKFVSVMGAMIPTKFSFET